MPPTFAKLRKLRNRSLPELRERGRQELSKLTERLLHAPRFEMSDRALLRAVSPELRNGSAVTTTAAITGRMRAATATAAAVQPSHASNIFPSPAARSGLIDLIKREFPAHLDWIMSQAERAIEGRFDLLGYRDLNFGYPIEWRLEPISGKRTGLEHWSTIDYLDPNVAGDKKITWELNRHAHFVTLGQAYWVTGDERFAHAFVEQACLWMDANPPRRGINWASSLEVSLRAIAWLWALHLMADSESLTPQIATRLLKCLVAHGRHISAYLSHYFSPNTHLTGEALGLLYLGTTLPELGNSRRWRLKGLAILLEQLPLHIGPDGVYFEQSTYYHRYTADFYTHALLLAQTSRLVLPREVEDKLSASLEYLMWITRPNGSSPCIGDDDGGRLIKFGDRSPDDFRDTLAIGAALFKRGDWKHVAGDAPAEMLWLLGQSGLNRYRQMERVQPAERSKSFSDSGYFVMRDGWEEKSSYVIADCGSHSGLVPGAGLAHSHADSLSFEFAARGTTWLLDPGTFTYTADPKLRDWFRSSAAHNTVVVDGESQSISAGPFKWERVANATAHQFVDDEAFCYFEGSQDGYERLPDPVTHTRSLLFVKSDGGSSLSPYLLIRDSFDAASHHRYSARFQLAAGCSASKCRNTVIATAGRGEKMSISAWNSRDGSPGPAALITDSWISPAYGERRKAPAAEFQFDGEGPCNVVSLILPESKNSGLASVSHSKGVYSISTADSFDLFACPDKSAARSNLISADCQLAWARFIEGRLSRGCLIRGTRLEISRGLSIFSSGLSWLSFALSDGWLTLRARGASQLEVIANEPVAGVMLNGTTFNVDRGAKRMKLTLAEAGWKLEARS